MNPIKIDGLDYDVNEFEPSFGDELNGYIKYGTQEMAVDKNLNKWQRNATILHECLHGISTHRSLDLSEKQVESLTFGMIGLMRDNRELVDCIMEGRPYGVNS